ncbi:MAG: response regulator transcription factor [Armatimonadetes bacterium]|nr:response regulator transcription factor [Armatimonadota bacterium]
MRVLIATRAPQRFFPWLSFLEREGVLLLVAAPEARQVGQVLGDGAPDATLLDLLDDGCQVEEFRHLLGQLYPGESIGCIVIVPRQRLMALAGEEIDDVVEAAAAPEEVLFRLRRVAARQRRTPPAIELAELVIRPAEGQAVLAGRPLPLRYREFQLLRFLACHPDRVFRREELVREVWGPRFRGSLRTVDVHIRRLRDRLGTFGEQHLQTVWRIGYRMAALPDNAEVSALSGR